MTTAENRISDIEPRLRKVRKDAEGEQDKWLKRCVYKEGKKRESA